MRIDVIGIVSLLCLGVLAGNAAAQQTGAVCAKPWAFADKWIDNHDETEPIDQIWTSDDTFETVDAQGNPLPDADVYIPVTSPGATGFSNQDVGTRVFLKVGDPSSTLEKGWFFAVDVGNAGGGAHVYRTAISFCDPLAPTTVTLGQTLPLLMGNLRGPTIQGANDLFSLDPWAYWDEVNTRIGGSCALFPDPCASATPRLAVIAAFDPAEFERSRATAGGPQLRVSNVVGVFIEGYYDGFIIGRLTPVPVPQP